ncbi:hypothetical protein PC118_g18242 [Phytophthora cactorum]|uniref:SET domain-containing protein n=1 Tax=Phytophthora cactorum TaxID=29920 RepID=A0A8T1F4G6_9STRA|nr:hypothetical protein PC111_g20395 [Phytophthora cactorum]KAG2831942.1 hypothetical protein PC113_g20845 [Phytophthora cactorum]KAG2968064.1 hypothetical protein PC118_g18242 [Phytophthora cactorum]KAG2979875.1 hypothetical protein PC119_g21363 [Phytophthora cactorum]KAG3134539.1 hypothetical protein C6341_g22115 [Phytophthora cactorum]
MLLGFRLSSLRFILKIDEEPGKWLIMRNYQDAAAAPVWEPNNIIVIESSSGSDEDTKADWPDPISSASPDRVTLSAPILGPADHYVDITVRLRGAPGRTTAQVASDRQSATKRSLADSLQGAVADLEHTRQRTDSSTRQYSRPKTILPPPHRPNYVLHVVRFKRAIPKARKSPESSPSATATIVTGPMSNFAGTASSRVDRAYSFALTVDFVSSPWPAHVVYLHDYYNPASLKLPYELHYGDCNCSDPCQIDTCHNAQMNVLCTDSCCYWEELCANRPCESPKVEVKRNGTTGKYALVAKTALNHGEVLGEYLGRLRYVESNRTMRPRNEGSKLTLRTKTDGSRSRRVGIGAYQLGGQMRFANHACDANAEFFEFAYGARHTVVVVTTGAIEAGSEVTVNYGTDLWFVCRCKYTKCIHASTQDEEVQ